MNFGQALEALRLGSKVARRVWIGKNMFIYLVKGTNVNFEDLRNEASDAIAFTKYRTDGVKVSIGSHIDMKAEDESIIVGWSPSQADMLAEDWVVMI